MFDTYVYSGYFSTTGGSKFLRALLSYEIIDGTTDYTIHAIGYINVKTGWYTNAKLVNTLSCTNQTSVKRTVDNMNYQGTQKVIPANDSYTTFTIPKTTSSQTITLKWAISNNGGKSGYVGTAQTELTIPALSPITISYDANGGSGTIASTSGYANYPSTITSSLPTRTNYIFKSWNTLQDGTGTTIASGGAGTFTGNTTLYAQWKYAYVLPQVQSQKAYRVSSTASGVAPSVSPSGERVYFQVITTKGSLIQNYIDSFSYTVTDNDGTIITPTESTLSVDTSNTDYAIYYGYLATLDKDYGFTISASVTVKDGANETHTLPTVGSFVSPEQYVLDIKADGKGVAFFKRCENDGLEIDGNLLASGNISIDGEANVGSLKIDSNSIADYVTEASSSGNWKWQKWHSGKIEAWYKGDSKNYACTSTSGGIKYAPLETVTYPSGLFTENPDAWASFSNQTQGSTDNGWVTIRENTATNIRFYVNRGASATITGRVHIYAIGT